jgi:hypothetical protein
MAVSTDLQIFSLLLRDELDAVARALEGDADRQKSFLGFLSRNHLRLYLVGGVRGTALERAIPESWVNRLDEFAHTQLARKEGLVAELMELRETLMAADLEFILLKGPYIAERFFGGLERRFFSDLDLFVREERLADVERALGTRGFRLKSTALLGRSLTTPFVHALDFGSRGMTLDLHWRLSAHVSFRVNYDQAWATRREFVLRDVAFDVLSDEYELVLHTLSIFRDLERGVGRIKPFVDVFAILREVEPTLDWTAFFDRRRPERIGKIVVNILAMTLELLSCRDLFPRLAAALDRERDQVRMDASGSYLGLLGSSPGALHNKLWTSRVYDCSRAVAGAWWLVSLPFRLAVYHPGKYRRFTGNLKRWTHLDSGASRREGQAR